MTRLNRLMGAMASVLLLIGCAGTQYAPQGFPTSPSGARTPSLAVDSSLDNRDLVSLKVPSGKRLLYVLSEFPTGSTEPGVYVFDQDGQDQSPEAYIGLSNDPSAALEGLAIDSAGTLYVANETAQTVMEFPKNSGNPSKTLTGLDNPWNVIVGKDATVYVANQGNGHLGSVTEFLNSSTRPSFTIRFKGVPYGMALDAKDNLYVGYNNAYDFGEVMRFKPHAKSGANLYLFDASQPFSGIALGNDLHLYVSAPSASEIFEYRLPGENIIRTIGSGELSAPEALALNQADSRLWAVNYCCGGILAVDGFGAELGKLQDKLDLEPAPFNISGLAAYPPAASQ